MNTNNLILNVDSYKAEGHWEQYPPNTTKIFSYIESRGCNFSSEMMMFGLQMFIKEYLSKPITQADIDEANEIFMAHGGSFNKEGWQYVLDNYNGFLPVSIKAVPEGMIVPTHSVLVTVENTDPNCYWLTSYLETALLRAVWYPSTVASNCFYLKQQIYNALQITSDNPDSCGLEFKLHSFGFRGVSSLESGGIGDVAHLVSFRGTDTMAGITYARKYYDCDMAGYSIKASEHSTQTSWTRVNERDAYKNLVDKYAAPGVIFASVIDSYDTFGAIDIYADTGLLDTVKERGATIVLRPDSGDPLTMPCDVIEYLMSNPNVGYTINSKGFKVLPPHVRVIQGDGVNVTSVTKILKNMMDRGLSIENIALGMGAGMLQQVDRDTYKMAMKCSYAEINGVGVDVYKQPSTDPNKTSKKGHLTLVQNDAGDVITKRTSEITESDTVLLREVYNCGPVKSAYETLDMIRNRADKFLL